MPESADSLLIDSWLHGKAKNTIDGYRRDVEQFRQFLSYKPLAEIDLEEIQMFATHLENRHLKDATYRRKINAVKSLYSFAVVQQKIPTNVAAAINTPQKNPNLAGRILSQEDTRKLIESAATVRDRLFLLVSYAIATRASETCALKWEDFTIRSDGKVQALICGKGGKVAPVLVPASVWESLQILRNGNERLFPFSRREGHNIIKQAVQKAGLNPKISLHWMRHCHARHAIEAGAPLHVVRDSLRHSNIAVTNWYLQSMPDESSSDYLTLP